MTHSLTRRTLMAGFIASTSGAVAAEATGPKHVVLLGDSIFDNQAYVGQAPAVIDQVRTKLGPEWQATLLAIDGDITAGIQAQLKRIPASATHLVISVGGNDALQEQGVLNNPVMNSAETFIQLAKIQQDFGKAYGTMLDQALALGKPTTVCTIYDPNFPNPLQQQLSVAALAVFNDRITRAAFAHGLPVIDLRLLFSSPEDYANPIEPGPQGGEKIATAIARIVSHHDFSQPRSVVEAGN